MIPAHRPNPALSGTPRTGEVEQKREILERAIEEHFDTLASCVVRLLRRMNVFERSQARLPEDIAGDVLADACVAVLRNAERFEAGRDPVPWILGFAVNVAKRERDHVFKANRSASERPEVNASELAGEDQSGEDALEEHAATLALSLGLLDARRSTALETRQALASLLEPLAEADREVVVLSVFEGYDSPRLAQRLGTSAPAARKRLQRALHRLRAHIAGRPEQFSWIENLPRLLEVRGESRSTESMATQITARGENKDGVGCHSAGAASQHPEHDLPQSHRPPPSIEGDENAHARSSSMRSPLPAHAPSSATARGARPHEMPSRASLASGHEQALEKRLEVRDRDER